MTSSGEQDDRATVAVPEHGRLTAPMADEALAAVSVGPCGEAVALWARLADLRALHAPGPGRRNPTPIPAHVVVQTADRTTITPIAAFDLPFCQVQPLPDGRILAVAGRGGAARIFDADGELVRQGRLGDAINHVLTTPSGHVWAGYFDEGIFGADPLAHRGIARYTPELEPDWRYPTDPQVGPVDDCYTLNVDGEDAWSCYYSDFPVVRITDRTVTGWRTDLTGATALIADGDTCAVIGDGPRPRVIVGRLADGRFQPTGERVLALPESPQPTGPLRMVGRGSQLHVFRGLQWFQIGLGDLI
jgi:hypothetical protein